MQHLVDKDSLDALAREGLPDYCVPTEQLRDVYLWVMDVYYRGGQIKAPSLEAITEEWGDILSDHEVEIDTEPADTIEWAIDDLKGSYVWRITQEFNKRFAVAVSDAKTKDRVGVVEDYSTELVALVTAMESQESRVDVREGMSDRLRAYEARSQDATGTVYGMRMGLPMVDQYTRGVHPGELAVLAAGPKVGKSFALAMFALNEWQAGRTAVLFTLENSVQMTLDRMACFAQHLDYRQWQQGRCTPEEIARVREWVEMVSASEVPLYVIRPDIGQRSVEAMVRQAHLYGADSLFIDQLTFIEPPDERAPRHIQIRDMTHSLKSMISTGRRMLPTMLAHQINREGVKAADKVGRLEMFHLAEGSEVERTADWVFGLYRSKEDVLGMTAKFQTLAARREDLKHFRLTWQVGVGQINVRGQWDPEVVV